MSEIITATYRDGAFVPEQAPGLAAGTRVRLVVQTLDVQPQAANGVFAQFDELCDEISVIGGKHLTRQELHDRR
jgi:predicted DNA-binding antitoxin AbrB/MazE fold protein